MSLPSGALVSRLGYKASIVAGLVVAAVGALLFHPAARLPSYGLFLLALFVLASGITLLQVAANPYISLLGEPASSHSRLNLAQALNSLGTTLFPYFIGPLILSAAVLGADQLAALSPDALAAYRATQAHFTYRASAYFEGELDEEAFFDALTKMGIETKTKDLQVFAGGSKKGDWDVGLAVDAIKMAPRLDTVIIVSGDGDFIPLVQYLQTMTQVEVISFGKSTSMKLKEVVDDFVDLSENPRRYLIGTGRGK
mgnify:CR=1 FL=1